MRGAALLLSAALLAACGNSGTLAPVDVRGSTLGSGGSGSSIARVSVCGGHVVVAAGDTIYGISQRCDVPMRAMIAANDLQPPFILRVGQVLQVPTPRLHTVAAGETLYGISRQYGTDLSQLARQNGLAAPYIIVPGQALVIPNPGAAGPIVPPTARAASVSRSGGGAPPRPIPRPTTRTATPPVATARVADGVPVPRPRPARAGSTEASPPTAAPTRAPAALTGPVRFDWPLRGRIVSSFGAKAQGRHNDGVNIAAPKGTAVRAAEVGEVAYAGSGLRGFGNLLLIRHADGWITAYAHNDRLLVERGDRVVKGQVIARVGNTGGVDQPQLHFEIRKGREAVDPLDHLPRAGS